MIQSERYRSVQVLRGVAALMVALFHITKLTAGVWGVDIFFVISGFIMGTIGRQETPLSFAVHRLIRIVPLYWAITLGMCGLSLVPGLFSTFSFDAVRLFKSLFFIPYTDATGHLWPLLVVGWTLNYEMLFYLVFALGLGLKRPMMLCAAVFASLSLLTFFVVPRDDIPRFLLNPIMLEFLAGLALSQWVRLCPKWLGPLALAAGIGGLCTAALFASISPLMRVFAVGLPAAFIVSGSIIIEKKWGWSPRLVPLEFIGDCSFSIYLLHGIVNTFGHKILGQGLLVNGLILIASLAAGIVSYLLIEKTTGRWLRHAWWKFQFRREAAS